MLNYQPVSKTDSLAYRAWREDGFNLERAHVQLAEYYAKRGDFLKASQEYKALTYITPFNSSPYLLTADMLIKARQLNESVPFLLKSLELENTAFANKWLGQIYLERGQTKESLIFLKRAAEMAPEDPQLIYNLSGAYALNRQYKLAMDALEELEKLNPHFPGADDLKRQLEKL
jgi:tetratricopeptide (TPR) repeat protein